MCSLETELLDFAEKMLERELSFTEDIYVQILEGNYSSEELNHFGVRDYYNRLLWQQIIDNLE